MITLSLCMIVRDEEDNLARCLSSVSDIFDNIHIVDTGSIDNTKSVAKSYNAKVYDYRWIDNFADARNFSFSKSVDDYIMWLDADDIILPKDLQLLRDLKPNLATADAWLSIYNYAQDENGQCIAKLYRHRILRNKLSPKWLWPIHECLDIKPNWTQATANFTVTHKRTVKDQQNDAGRNLRILKKAVSDNKTEPRLLFYYGKELFYACCYKETIKVLNDYLKIGGWHDDEMNARYMIAVSYANINDGKLAIETCLNAIKRDPKLAEFYVTIGQVLYNDSKWNEAIPWFKIATTLEIPNILGPVMVEYYTWIPHDRLCKSYGEIGMYRESYLANQKALSYRPNDSRLLYNKKYLLSILNPSTKNNRPIRVSLGSGGKHTNSYILTDKFEVNNIVEIIDQSDTPYDNATVHAIYSEHALEHSESHNKAVDTIKEWSRILRYGGKLCLKIPDLEECCRQFLAHVDRPRLPRERYTEKEWYLYTIYGIQQSQNGEPNIGQYHNTGFTKDSISRLLKEHGFRIDSIVNYDGHGTPSLEVNATQINSRLKVGWLLPTDLDDNNASLRIRMANVSKWLLDNNVDSQIVNYHKNKDLYHFDVCIFMFFGLDEFNLIDDLKRHGIKCIIDCCEDVFGIPYQNECLAFVDCVVCCSTVLADKIKSINHHTIVIPDAYEEMV